MLRAAFEHPKLKRLCKALSVPRFVAVGLLESLWHFAARYAPQGDIGRFSDDDIGEWIGCRDVSRHVRALIEAGWIDTSREHRLVVHHWHDHADEAVKKLLERKGLKFLSIHVETRLDVSRLPVPVPEPVPGPVPEPEPVPESLVECDGFAEFWNQYPRKLGRKAAAGKYRATLKKGATVADLLAAATNYARACEGKEPQYIKHGATFLGPDEHWRDYVAWQPEVSDPTAALIARIERAGTGGG